MLNKETIIELQTIIREDYGKDLSHDEAFSVGTTLVSLFGKLSDLEKQSNEKNK